jgi:polysaccharide export outer membrane protein
MSDICNNVKFFSKALCGRNSIRRGFRVIHRKMPSRQSQRRLFALNANDRMKIKMNKANAILTLLLPLLCLLGTSCTPQLLFQQKEGTSIDAPVPLPSAQKEHILSVGDKITLSVWGHEELGVGSTFSVYNSTLESGKYIILNEKGEIDLPLIGKIKLQGLNIREANLLLEGRYNKFLHDPIIRLRVLSRKVTILGEVNAPGNYELDAVDKNLMEIVGEAAGFTDYADLSKVTIVRRKGNEQEKLHFDLTDEETLFMVDLTLRDRDLIYVPERRGKEADKVAGRLVPIAGLVGSAALLISVLRR